MNSYFYRWLWMCAGILFWGWVFHIGVRDAACAIVFMGTAQLCNWGADWIYGEKQS